MTQDHCFPQLIQILHELNRANPNEDEDDSESDDEDGSLDQDGGRLLGLPGIRGEAKLEMLTPEILQQINAQRNSTAGVNKETADEDFENSSEAESNSENEMAFDEAWNVDKEGNFENQEKVQRQTFIYSATLTLPYTSTKEVGRQKRRRRNGLEGGIAQILEKCHAMGETKVVDLSTSSSSPRSGSNRQGVKLPPGLRLEEIKCTQRHKDSHLYAYLMTTSQGSAGPALVFCNSIAAVRRVGKTLQTLGLSVRILHANMQQVRRYVNSHCFCWAMREKKLIPEGSIKKQQVGQNGRLKLPAVGIMSEQSLSSMYGIFIERLLQSIGSNSFHVACSFQSC